MSFVLVASRESLYSGIPGMGSLPLDDVSVKVLLIAPVSGSMLNSICTLALFPIPSTSST